MNVQIAQAAPFTGKPSLLTPTVFGVSTGKPFLWRIPAIGERPLNFIASGLPEGVKLEGRILSGCIAQDGEWSVELTAENAQGRTVKTLRLTSAPDNALRTPLMGFTTWNAFAHTVTQQDVERTAQQLVDLGLADYGYSYVNLDSGWQLAYGGGLDAVQPGSKFSDMEGMYDFIHSLGLRGGIYSTPMLKAWGCPPELESIPGCTRGEPEPLLTNRNGGIGTEHLEENNARQWERWGVDYLKYDWMPTDPVTCDPMKQALRKLSRDIPLCVTVNAEADYGWYWSKNCCSWRNNPDSIDQWESCVKIADSVKGWKPYVCPGHFFDLDMLEIGEMFKNQGARGLTDAEELFCYTLRAFFASPLQLSCRLESLTEFERDLFCNEEVIAIHQDALADYPEEIRCDASIRIYSRRLENGDVAYALFNMENQPHTEQLELIPSAAIRDVWQKKDLPVASALRCDLPPHGACILRVSPA